MLTKTVARSAFAAVLALAFSVASQAGPVVAYTDPAGMGNQTYGTAKGGTLGLDFMVNSPTGIDIFSVGAFDSGQDGFNAPLILSFYNLASNSMVWSTTLQSGTWGTVVQGDRLTTLATPLFLAPGSYSIVTDGWYLDKNGNSLNGSMSYSNFNTGGGLITSLGSRFGGAGAFPKNVDGIAGIDKYGAGTFSFAAAPAGPSIPEPGTFFAMGAGLLALGLWSRRSTR